MSPLTPPIFHTAYTDSANTAFQPAPSILDRPQIGPLSRVIDHSPKAFSSLSEIRDYFLSLLSKSQDQQGELSQITSFVIARLSQNPSVESTDAPYSLNPNTQAHLLNKINFLALEFYPGETLFTLLTSWIDAVNKYFAVSADARENQKILLPLLIDACHKQPHLIPLLRHLACLANERNSNLFPLYATRILIDGHRLESGPTKLAPTERKTRLTSTERKYLNDSCYFPFFQAFEFCSLDKHHDSAVRESVDFIMAALNLSYAFHTCWYVPRNFSLFFTQAVICSAYSDHPRFNTIHDITLYLIRLAGFYFETPLLSGPVPPYLGTFVNPLQGTRALIPFFREYFFLPSVEDLLAQPSNNRPSLAAQKNNLQHLSSYIRSLIESINCSADTAIHFGMFVFNYHAQHPGLYYLNDEALFYKNAFERLACTIKVFTNLVDKYPFLISNNPSENCFQDLVPDWRSHHLETAQSSCFKNHHPDPPCCILDYDSERATKNETSLFAIFLEYARQIYDCTKCSARTALDIATHFLTSLENTSLEPIDSLTDACTRLKSLNTHEWDVLRTTLQDPDAFASELNTALLFTKTRGAQHNSSSNFFQDFIFCATEIIKSRKYSAPASIDLLSRLIHASLNSDVLLAVLKVLTNIDIEQSSSISTNKSEVFGSDFISVIMSKYLDENTIAFLESSVSELNPQAFEERLIFLITCSDTIMKNLLCSRNTAFHLMRYIIESQSMIVRRSLTHADFKQIIQATLKDILAANIDKHFLETAASTSAGTNLIAKICNSSVPGMPLGTSTGWAPEDCKRIIDAGSSYIALLSKYASQNVAELFEILSKHCLSFVSTENRRKSDIFTFAEKAFSEVIIKHPFFKDAENWGKPLLMTLAWSNQLLEHSPLYNTSLADYQQAIQDFLSFALFSRHALKTTSQEAIKRTVELLWYIHSNYRVSSGVSLILSRLQNQLKDYPLSLYFLPFIHTDKYCGAATFQGRIHIAQRVHCFLEHFQEQEHLDALLAIPQAIDTLFHHIHRHLASSITLDRNERQGVIQSFRTSNPKLMATLDYITLVKNELKAIDNAFVESMFNKPSENTLVAYLLEKDVYTFLQQSTTEPNSQENFSDSAHIRRCVPYLCAMIKMDPKRTSIAKYPRMLQHIIQFFLNDNKRPDYARLCEFCISLVNGWHELFCRLREHESLIPLSLDLTNRRTLKNELILILLRKIQPDWQINDFIVRELTSMTPETTAMNPWFFHDYNEAANEEGAPAKKRRRL